VTPSPHGSRVLYQYSIYGFSVSSHFRLPVFPSGGDGSDVVIHERRFRLPPAFPDGTAEALLIPARIARAVEVASHLVPRSTCLTKALAAHVLLRRVGHEGVLHIGVARDEAGKFEAHAWLECQGKVIIGGGPRWFVPLPPIGMDG